MPLRAYMQYLHQLKQTLAERGRAVPAEQEAYEAIHSAWECGLSVSEVAKVMCSGGQGDMIPAAVLAEPVKHH